jgi:hypothetical protein
MFTQAVLTMVTLGHAAAAWTVPSLAAIVAASGATPHVREPNSPS